MIVSQSLQGVARGNVIAPAGKFYVVNATFTNYQAYVANNTTITFSAGASFDPNGPASNNNFTWRFTPSDTGWNITSTYKYLQSGQYIVNLTMREGGGNLSCRNMTIWVDDQFPVARIDRNRTGGGGADGMRLTEHERITIRFDGAQSTDPHNTNATLTYTWTSPGPITGNATQTNPTLYGMNVSFAWLEWNNSYKVTLSVRHSGFRDADSAKPNTGNLSRNINVQIDPLLHADLRIEAGTLKVTPADP